jgi:hypothetical protein
MSDSRSMTTTSLWQKDHGEVLTNYIKAFNAACVEFSDSSHSVAKVLDGLSDNTYTRSLESIFTSIDSYINGQFEVLRATLAKEIKKNEDIAGAFKDKGNEEAVEMVKAALANIEDVAWDGADLQDGGKQPTVETSQAIVQGFVSIRDVLLVALNKSSELVNDMNDMNAMFAGSVANFHGVTKDAFTAIVDELNDSKTDFNKRIDSVNALVARVRAQSSDDAMEAVGTSMRNAGAKKEKVEMPDALA